MKPTLILFAIAVLPGVLSLMSGRYSIVLLSIPSASAWALGCALQEIRGKRLSLHTGAVLAMLAVMYTVILFWAIFMASGK